MQYVDGHFVPDLPDSNVIALEVCHNNSDGVESEIGIGMAVRVDEIKYEEMIIMTTSLIKMVVEKIRCSPEQFIDDLQQAMRFKPEVDRYTQDDPDDES
jgi:hypothetical protein